jgi:hypothetical protein
LFQSYKTHKLYYLFSLHHNVDREKSIIYCDSDGEEKIWSGFARGPEPEIIPCSTLDLPSLQQEQLSDWAYDQQVAYEAYKRARQHTQDPAEQQTQEPAP